MNDDAAPVVRVAGLAAGTLGARGFETTFRRLGLLIARRTALAAEGAALADLLYPVIGELSGRPEKARVVGLRRALHGCRIPASRERDERTLAALPAATGTRVRAWLAEFHRVRAMTAELPGVLESDVAGAVPELLRAAGTPAFRRALSQASPALFAELGKWLAQPDATPGRRTVFRLAKYLARSAAKTSPYSTFTVSGLGRWEPCGAPIFATSAPEACGQLELHASSLARLTASLTGPASRRASLAVRVNPGLTTESSPWQFPGPELREPLLAVEPTAALRECLRIVREAAPRSLDEVYRLLAERCGADPGQARGFVDNLIERGLLELVPPVADQVADPLAGLLHWLERQHDGEPGAESGRIERLREALVRPVPVGAVDSHVDRQRDLRLAAGELGLSRGDEAGFHENAVFPGSPVSFDPELWAPVRRDLSVALRWFTLFEPTLPMRLALADFHAERFGARERVSVIELHRAVQEVLAGDPAGGAAGDLRTFFNAPLTEPVPELLAACHGDRLRELGELRAKALARLDGSTCPDGVLTLDPDALLAELAGWPDWLAPPAMLSCYLQPDLSGKDFRVVLNAAGIGHGRGRSRVAHLVERAGGAPVPPVAADDPAGPAYAEFTGLFGSTLNLRAPAVPYEIDYPRSFSRRPAEQRIAVGELLAGQHAGRQVLYCPRLGREVRVSHLGLLASALLPPLAKLLCVGFGGSYVLHSGTQVLPVNDDGAEVVRLPRLNIGRVVLRRSRWVVPEEAVPRRSAGEQDAAYLLRLTEWRIRHGIPDRCYVRGRDESRMDGPELDQWLRWVSAKERKPMYVDFTDWFLVLAFEHLTGSVAGLLLEEALPAPADSPVWGEDGPRVTEVLIEQTVREP